LNVLEQDSIAIRVRADNTEAKNSFTELRTFAKGSVDALSRELKLLSQIDAFGKLKKDVIETERAWKDATAHVADLARKMQGVEEPTAKMVKEFDRAKTSAAGLKDNFLAQRDALNNLRTSLSQAGVNTKQLGDAQTAARVKVEALSAKLAQLKQNQSDFGTIGVRSSRDIRREMDGLSVAFNRLANSGTVSQRDLARALESTKAKTAELRKELAGGSGQGGLAGALGFVGKVGPGAIAAAVGSIASNQIVQAIKNVSLLTARYDTLGVAMRTVGRNAGYTRGELEEYQRVLQKTGIAAIESRTAIMRLAQAQVPLENAAKLARIAQDAAVIGGINSSEAFERMINGMVTAQPLILRNIGIMVDFERTYKAAAKALGKNSSELTEQEKLMARVNAVMAQGSKIAGTYEASMETAGKKISSTTRHVQDLEVETGRLFQPLLTRAVDEYTFALQRLNNALNKIDTDAAGLAIADVVAAPSGGAVFSNWYAYFDVIKRYMIIKRKEGNEQVELDAAESEARQVDEFKAAADRKKAIDDELAELQKLNLDSVLEKAKATLKEAEAAAERYAARVIELEKAKELAQMSTQERVRALLRTQMSEQESYNDSLKEAQETLNRARQAAEQGQGDEAIKWAEKAQSQFERLNREVKDGEQIFVNAATANKTAVQGVLDAGNVIAQAYDTMKTAAEESRQAEENRKTQILTDIEEIEAAMARVEALEIEVSADDQATPKLEAIQRELAQIKDKTITVTVKYVETGKKPKGYATGGIVQAFANGGQAIRRFMGRVSGPGSGTSDSILARLSNGEYVIPARIVQKFGVSFFDALRAGMVPQMPRYAMGGAVNMPTSVSGSSEALTVTFRAGDMEAPVRISDRTSRESMKAFARELQKIRLVQG